MEYIDIYDENKQLTGRSVPRKGYKLQEGEYQLIVIALIERPDHTFLITRRSLDKKWAAGAWEVSGGGVHAGETSFQGIVREVSEEVGLDVSQAEGGCVYTYSNVDLERGDNYFTDIYHFHLDFDKADVVLQEEEAIDCALATLEEIGKLAESGDFLHYKRIMEALAAEGQA